MKKLNTYLVITLLISLVSACGGGGSGSGGGGGGSNAGSNLDACFLLEHDYSGTNPNQLTCDQSIVIKSMVLEDSLGASVTAISPNTDYFLDVNFGNLGSVNFGVYFSDDTKLNSIPDHFGTNTKGDDVRLFGDFCNLTESCRHDDDSEDVSAYDDRTYRVKISYNNSDVFTVDPLFSGSGDASESSDYSENIFTYPHAVNLYVRVCDDSPGVGEVVTLSTATFYCTHKVIPISIN